MKKKLSENKLSLKFLFVLFSLVLIPAINLSGTTSLQPVKHQFILVHGAWHGSWCWFEIETLLRRKGHLVKSVDLPGHKTGLLNKTNITLNDYQHKLEQIIDASNQPVILVGHSLGGVPISLAAEARPHKVNKLIYLAAFLLKDKQSFMDVANKDVGSKVLENVMIDQGKGVATIKVNNAREIFYQCCDNSYVALSRKLLVSNPLGPLFTPVFLTEQNYGSVRRFYIKTTMDQAVTPRFQNMMIEAMPCERVYEIHTDHSPFYSTPSQLTQILLDIANDDTTNLVNNAEFDNGINGWKLEQETGQGADATIKINKHSLLSGENSVEIKINHGGEAKDSIRLVQNLGSIKKFKQYSVYFQAKTHDKELQTIDLCIKKLNGVHPPYWQKKDLEVTRKGKKFGPFNFFSHVDDDQIVLTFDVGSQNSTTLYIDDIIIDSN